MQLNNNLSLKLEDYIIVVEDALTHTLCDDILKEYAYSDEWNQGKLSNLNNELTVVKSKRDCFTIFLSGNETINKNYNIRKKIDEEIFKCVGKAVEKYKNKFNEFIISNDSGYQLLKYEKNGFIENHIDSLAANEHRTLSCSLILNDNFEGGEFSFFNNKLKYKLKKGSAILFPSNFMYPHSILPIKKGIRYSIITWLV